MPATVAEMASIEPVYECLPGWQELHIWHRFLRRVARRAKDYLAFLEARTRRRSRLHFHRSGAQPDHCAQRARGLSGCCDRAAIALVLAAGAVTAQASGPSPREIVERAVALDRDNVTRIRDFTYRQRQLERQYDSSGKVKGTSVKTWEISFLEGSPYRKLVARMISRFPPTSRSSSRPYALYRRAAPQGVQARAR